MLRLLGNSLDLCSWGYAHGAWVHGKIGHQTRSRIQDMMEHYAKPTHISVIHTFHVWHIRVVYCDRLTNVLIFKCICLSYLFLIWFLIWMWLYRESRQTETQLNALYTYCVIQCIYSRSQLVDTQVSYRRIMNIFLGKTQELFGALQNVCLV